MTSTPTLELADIFRRYAPEYIQSHGPTTPHERRVLDAIQRCRTVALGGHVEKCDHCGHTEVFYNSCRNLHCPKCQAAARARWLEARQDELLPVEYFHLVFTLAEEFRPIALQNKKTVYGILFRAAAETLCQLARDPKHLGAEIGFFGILHTWGQNLSHHPHVHFVVPGGGLSPDRAAWVSAPRGFFLPIKVLKLVFRGKFIAHLKRAFTNEKLVFRGSLAELADSKAFNALLDNACRHEWVVYAKQPFGGPQHVLKYLARYTHRVAIANQRLISMDGGRVTFRWKDYADHNRMKVMNLDVFEFIRRFLLHVVPPRFTRIRYYGFLSTRNRTDSLALCRRLLTQAETANSVPDGGCEPVDSGHPEEQRRSCPVCKKGTMVIIEDFGPSRWRPDPSRPESVDTS